MDERNQQSPFSEVGTDFKEKSDAELINLIRSGSAGAVNAVFCRYAPRVRAVSSKYFADALTNDDWFQEGMLGLLYAVHSYDADSSVQFSTYAAVCVRNRLNTVWKLSNSAKNSPLNNSVPIDESDFPAVSSPEEDYIKNEAMDLLREKYSSVFSETERQAVFCYLSGLSYEETAKRLNIPVKSVDNALYRAKQKLQKYFSQ